MIMQKKTGFRQKITWQEATNQKPSQPQDRCDNIGSQTPIGLLFLYVRADVEQIVSEADDDSTIT
jgi:hypothetical protein